MADTAERLRGFGPLGISAVLVILAAGLAGALLSAAVILAWAWSSHTPLQDLGFRRPRSWMLTVATGIALGVVLKLAMKAVVMPLLGAPAINARYHYLMGNSAALPGMLAAVVVVAGFGEEVVFRGYLFERLGKLFGRGIPALAGTILFSSALFAAAHYSDQRLPGVEQAAVMGLAYGALYVWRRQIWLVMIVHAAFDITAVALIYRGWEVPVAHWLFR